MMDFFTTIAAWLGAERYSQHSICLTNDQTMILMYVAGDLTTAASYFVIGWTLYANRLRVVTMSSAVRALYGAFIFLCGMSHLTEVLTLFWGVYRLDVIVTAAMAAVSAATAVMTTSDLLGDVEFMHPTSEG